jgi:hypothetical protein
LSGISASLSDRYGKHGMKYGPNFPRIIKEQVYFTIEKERLILDY